MRFYHSEPDVLHSIAEIIICMASPILALIMSFFIPGLGQLYTGQFLKAVALFILALLFGGLSTILIGIPFYIIVWVYSMYDAYKSAVD